MKYLDLSCILRTILQFLAIETSSNDEWETELKILLYYCWYSLCCKNLAFVVLKTRFLLFGFCLGAYEALDNKLRTLGSIRSAFNILGTHV